MEPPYFASLEGLLVPCIEPGKFRRIQIKIKSDFIYVGMLATGHHEATAKLTGTLRRFRWMPLTASLIAPYRVPCIEPGKFRKIQKKIKSDFIYVGMLATGHHEATVKLTGTLRRIMHGGRTAYSAHSLSTSHFDLQHKVEGSCGT